LANTYTQLHIHLVFAVKYRQALIEAAWKADLHKYLTVLIQAHEHKLLQVNSMPDHVHILAGIRPHEAISTLVQHIKTESSKWIKAQSFATNFSWQEGFGAFSYSRSHVSDVIRYIQNQEAHHRKENFLDEYRRMLNAFEIAYDEDYLFKEPM
jgi:REP element-mobilizing transposase RayT